MKSGVFVLAAVFILILSTGFVSLIAQDDGGCTDSDGGLDYFEKGELTADGTVYEDVCMDSNFVTEYFCDNPPSYYDNYYCPNICKDGACIDAVLLSNSNDNLNLGNNWGIFTGTIDGEDLNILADGTYLAGDNDEFDYEQSVTLGSPTNFIHFRDRDYEILVGLVNSTPILGFNIADTRHVMNYTLDFIQDAESTVTLGNLDDLEGTNLHILGKTYYVVEARSGTADHVGKLTLLDNVVVSNVEEGGSLTTVNVGDKSYVVSTFLIGPSSVTLDINGESLDINGERVSFPYPNLMPKRLSDGSYISIGDVYHIGLAGEINHADFVIARNKLELGHGQDIKLNDDTIVGIKAYMPKGTSTSSNEKLDKIVIEWKTDEKVFLTEDVDLEMPGGLGNIKFTMGLVRNEEKITIQPDGDDSIEITVPITDGMVSFNLLYGSNGVFTGLGKASDERLATSPSLIGTGSNNLLTFQEKDSDGNDYHKWFVASYNTASEGESYLLKAEVSNGKVNVYKNDDGFWLELSNCEDLIVGNTCNIGDVSITIEDIEFIGGAGENVTFAAGTGVSFNKLFTKNGLTIYLPDENQVSGSSYELLFAEENKDDELAENQFKVVLNKNQDNKFQVGGINIDPPFPPNFQKGDTGIYEMYMISDVATRFLHYTEPGDENYLEIYYPGEASETYAEVYLTGRGDMPGEIKYMMGVVYDDNAPSDDINKAIDIQQYLKDEYKNPVLIYKNSEVSLGDLIDKINVFYYNDKAVIIWGGTKYNVKTMSSKVEAEISNLFVEDQKALIYLPNGIAKIAQGEQFGLGFGIDNVVAGTNLVPTQEFVWAVTVDDDDTRRKCGIRDSEAESWITTVITGSANITSGQKYYDVIRFNIPEGAVSDVSTCIITYKLVIREEDGTHYTTEYFDIDVVDIYSSLSHLKYLAGDIQRDLKNQMNIDSEIIEDSNVPSDDLIDAWNLFFGDRYKELELILGWNLIPFIDLLTDPLENISEKDYRGSFLDNDIRAAFVFNPLYQTYTKLHRLFSNQRVITSIFDFIGWENRYMPLNPQSLYHTSYWVYSFSNQTISIPVVNNYLLVLAGTKLYDGWNFLIISEDMMGMSMNEWTGDCRVVKAAIWSSDQQGWDIAEPQDYYQEFEQDMLGRGLVLYVTVAGDEDGAYCELGDNIGPPPLPSGGTCTDNDNGFNYIVKGEICIDSICFDDYCANEDKLWEGYCDGNDANWREAWGDCEDGELVFESNEYLIVDNIGNNFIYHADTELRYCSGFSEEDPGIDLEYECDGHFAVYENKDYGNLGAIVFVRDEVDQFSEDEFIALKEDLLDEFEGFYEDDEFEDVKIPFEGNWIYQINRLGDSSNMSMYAWFDENKVIFISSWSSADEDETVNMQALDEIAKSYLIKYPSGLTD